MENQLKGLKAIANQNRLQILQWILDPKANFPTQKQGDLIEDGVCVAAITDKIGLKQPTVTSHMKVLAAAGLVTPKQIKNWVFFKPEADAIAALLAAVATSLKVGEDR